MSTSVSVLGACEFTSVYEPRSRQLDKKTCYSHSFCNCCKKGLYDVQYIHYVCYNICLLVLGSVVIQHQIPTTFKFNDNK